MLFFVYGCLLHFLNTDDLLFSTKAAWKAVITVRRICNIITYGHSNVPNYRISSLNWDSCFFFLWADYKTDLVALMSAVVQPFPLWHITLNPLSSLTSSSSGSSWAVFTRETSRRGGAEDLLVPVGAGPVPRCVCMQTLQWAGQRPHPLVRCCISLS